VARPTLAARATVRQPSLDCLAVQSALDPSGLAGSASPATGEVVRESLSPALARAPTRTASPLRGRRVATVDGGRAGAAGRELARNFERRTPTPAGRRRTVRLLGHRRCCQTPAPCVHSACTTNVRDRADARSARRPFGRLARSPARAGERQPYANVPTFVVDSFAGCERLQRAARRTRFRDVDRPPARQSVKGVGCGWRAPWSVRPVTDL